MAERHIRACPRGAMPWATSIRWQLATVDGHSSWAASAHGGWLNHRVEQVESTGHGASGGVELTDEVIGRAVAEAETGFPVADLRLRGRPELTTDVRLRQLTMGYLRRWVARHPEVPDDGLVYGTLPMFPRRWARGGTEYAGRLLRVEASYDHPDPDVGSVSTSETPDVDDHQEDDSG